MQEYIEKLEYRMKLKGFSPKTINNKEEKKRKKKSY